MIRASSCSLALSLAALPAAAEVPEAVAALVATGCEKLAQSDAALLDDVAARAEERLAVEIWDASLAGAEQQAYLATTTVRDLTALLSMIPALSTAEPEPSPAEIYGMAGDLFLATDRPELAIELYRRAARTVPTKEGNATRCSASYAGKIYTLDFYAEHFGYRSGLRHTPYLLTRDPNTGQVLERILLPEIPVALSIGEGALLIFYRSYPRSGAREIGTLHLPEGRLGYPLWAPNTLPDRIRLRLSGYSLVHNFIYRSDESGGNLYKPEFSPRGDVTSALPANLEDLEVALRQAVLRDPTQPWHLFFLGQCLWAQGSRREATAAWEGLFADGFRTIPYYEFSNMAWRFDLYQQPEWADAAFREALARRRNLTPPIAHSYSLEWLINAPRIHRRIEPEQWPKLDAERSYLWWLRFREISGVTAGDGFRAILWANYMKSIGDTERAADELAYLEQVRQYTRLPEARSLRAYQDYTLWTCLASLAGLLVVALVLFAKLLFFKARVVPAIFTVASLVVFVSLFDLPAGSPLWVFAALLLVSLTTLGLWPLRSNFFRVGWRKMLRVLLRQAGAALIPLLVFGASLAAYSFATFYVLRIHSRAFFLNDALKPQSGYAEDASQATRLKTALAHHAAGDFERARRLYESLPETTLVKQNLSALLRALPPLVSEPVLSDPRVDATAFWQSLEDSGLKKFFMSSSFLDPVGVILSLPRKTLIQLRTVFMEKDYPEIVLLAVALVCLLRPVRRWLGRAALILIPGAIFLRRRQLVRAYTTLWLFLFAAGPLLWLFLVKTSHTYDPLASPGPASWPMSFNLLTLHRTEFALPPPGFDQLLAENFWSLLWVYPYARLFYFLVALSLLAALYLHGRQVPGVPSNLKRRSRPRSSARS